ncbi:MAG: hypothetical protein H6782_04735 [Candidatus Nomurabacteria bacterium]|nr:MAG: hypothetical protein H6782_04735 [Candidatus Nomurabacteria bacterium]
MTNPINSRFCHQVLFLMLLVVLYLVPFFSVAEAASLSLSPTTGVYTANSTFTTKVIVNTEGKSVNAAEGTLAFNPNELSVVSVNRSGSIFNLWVTEPTFSNSAGTISFSGGLPSGFSLQTGTIMNVTFRTKGAGTARVNFKNGSVLANDGRGTNILTTMNGGSFTIQAASTAPEPEVIEYVAPANTPQAPSVTSVTHPDTSAWYKNNVAELKWSTPRDVTGVRTLLNEVPTSVPTKVYDNVINNIKLTDLPEGESYFHVQFRNQDGWGKVTHYRLAVDTKSPTAIKISHLEEVDLSSPEQVLKVDVEDETTKVNRFMVKLDSDEAYEYIDKSGSSTILLFGLEPGYHSVIIEAFDQAGNSIIGTHSFTIEAFDRPIFTEYPSEINEEVIPVIKGKTRPESTVQIYINKIGAEPNEHVLMSNEVGEFIFIPEGTFSNGVYELSAIATDKFGAQSDVSESIRIAVQQPGYLRIGSFIVSVLSVIVPLIVLTFVLILGAWYMLLYVRRFRKKVRIESVEALEILHREFSVLQKILQDQELILQDSRKTKKLTRAEINMVDVLDKALRSSQEKVEKEMRDVTELTEKQNNA